MANANEFDVARVAVASFTIPSNLEANTGSTLSCDLGVIIPTGAIITNLKYFVNGAMTNAANLGNATIQALVGTQSLGTTAVVASNALIAGSVYNHTLVGGGIGAGPIVSTGGILHIDIGASANRTGVVANCVAYVGYLMSL